MAYTFREGISLYETIGSVEPDTVWVEIGSDRGEGSTLALAEQAHRLSTHLHSVDIDSRAQDTLSYPALTCYVEPGSRWVKNTWPAIAKKISLLHLDNFDWIWDINNIPDWISSQISTYSEKFNVKMTNENCQKEHFEQLLGLGPWLADKCLVVMDDTFLHNGAWTGKCGPGVVYLQTLGFNVVKILPTNGTVLARGYDFLETVDTSIQIL